MLADLLDISPSNTDDPVNEPVDADDVKKQIEIPSSETDHDAYITELITEARQDVANFTRRSLIPKTITAKYTYGTRFKLFQPPFSAVTSISSFYEGTETVEDTSSFFVRSGLIPEYRIKHDKEYSATEIDEIEIVYTVGYADGSVPKQIKRAIIQRAADLFEARVGAEVGTIVSSDERGDWKHTLNMSGLVIPRA